MIYWSTAKNTTRGSENLAWISSRSHNFLFAGSVFVTMLQTLSLKSIYPILNMQTLVTGQDFLSNVFLWFWLFLISLGKQAHRLRDRAPNCCFITKMPLTARTLPAGESRTPSRPSREWQGWKYLMPCRLPPRICISRWPDSEADLGLKPGDLDKGCRHPKWWL